MSSAMAGSCSMGMLPVPKAHSSSGRATTRLIVPLPPGVVIPIARHFDVGVLHFAGHGLILLGGGEELLGVQLTDGTLSHALRVVILFFLEQLLKMRDRPHITQPAQAVDCLHADLGIIVPEQLKEAIISLGCGDASQA